MRVRGSTKQDPTCAVQAFVEAVHAGDIFWHAMPFNTQVEMFDGPLLQYAVEMTHELDAKFGQKPKHTMSQVRFCTSTFDYLARSQSPGR